MSVIVETIARPLLTNLREMEQRREDYWKAHPATDALKLRWRALAVRHCFHVVPGERILELGAGSGLWTQHLARVLRGENPITAATFDDSLADAARSRQLPNVRVVRILDFETDLQPGSFDYVVGTGILCHDRFAENLAALHRLLRPGGQLLFFEANFWNPLALVKHLLPAVGRWSGNASCQIGLRKYHLLKVCSQQGFSHVEIVPYDIIHPSTPEWLANFLQAKAIVLEQAPLLRELCGTLYIWARRPSETERARTLPNLAHHESLYKQVSIVVPCHNEEMNVGRLVNALFEAYEPYIHDIVLVNDNSTDGTSRAVHALARHNPRVRVIDRRPPGGVGRALADGFAAASGSYILSMDCDFELIVPELRDLFDAISTGYDGAIGSRFSHESILINYPFFKILCNRTFHLLVKVALLPGVRDLSNNLKLYRADILKDLVIEEPHFAANAETGLKPLMAGYRIAEVPISWIDRSMNMGSSSFRIARVAPGYARALGRVVRRAWRSRRLSNRSQPVVNKRSRTATASCPLCGATEVAVAINGRAAVFDAQLFGSSRNSTSHGEILRCERCDFRFSRERPSQDDLLRLYGAMDTTLYEAEQAGRAKTATRHIRFVTRMMRPGRLLDVGCASGAFLQCAIETGWSVAGVEPSSTLAETAKRATRGRAEVQCCSLQDARFEAGSFDAITLFDVLEHVPDPLSFVATCRRLLKTGGVLFVNVPDIGNWIARLLGPRWPLLLPEHLNYFNQKSLQRCAGAAGFSIVRSSSRMASFSMGYVLHRLTQHDIPGARVAASWLARGGLSKMVISIPLGESLSAWRMADANVVVR